MKVTVILPYFGKMPYYFHLWLKSAANNDWLNYLVFTDDNSINIQIPDNVQIVDMAFEEMQKRIHDRLGRFCKIDTPYKLCDYKPAYGVIFSDYLKDSDWWGYCDPDVIWGDLKKFLPDTLFETYEKILTLGHLTFYKNTEKVNTAFKKMLDIPYTAFEAFHLKKNVTFDETSGKILSDKGIYLTYDSRNDILDIWPHFFKFRTFDIREDQKENYFIAEYNNGHIYAHIVENDGIKKKEYMYIHLQKRQMDLQMSNTNRYCIIPNAFVDYSEEMINRDYIINVNEYQKINHEKSKQKQVNSFSDTLINIIRLFRKALWRIRGLF